MSGPAGRPVRPGCQTHLFIRLVAWPAGAVRMRRVELETLHYLKQLIKVEVGERLPGGHAVR